MNGGKTFGLVHLITFRLMVGAVTMLVLFAAATRTASKPTQAGVIEFDKKINVRILSGIMFL